MKCAGRLYLAWIARFTPVRLLCNSTRCNWRLDLYANIVVPLGVLSQSASLLMRGIVVLTSQQEKPWSLKA